MSVTQNGESLFLVVLMLHKSMKVVMLLIVYQLTRNMKTKRMEKSGDVDCAFAT